MIQPKLAAKSTKKKAECGKHSMELFGRTGNLMPKVQRATRAIRTEKRKWTAKDAARVVCYAVGSGASAREIAKEAGCCLNELCEEEKGLLERVLTVADAIASALAIASLAIPLLRLLPRLLSIPYLRPILRRILPAAVAAGLLERSASTIELAATEWRVITREVEFLLTRQR